MQIRLVLLFSLFALVNWAFAGNSHPSEQTHFSAEDEAVKKPALIPEDVLAALKKDHDVAEVIENDTEEKFSSSWFSASAIHLSVHRADDLVVVAEPPLAGANITTFWIFRAIPSGHSLVLKVGAHDLEVKPSRTNGYRDIEASAETAVVFTSALYKFDGKTYKAQQEKSNVIP